MKVALFALTGFGNKSLEALLELNCEVIFILTRREKNIFPYYTETNLAKYAYQKNIPIYENFKWDDVLQRIKKNDIKLILVNSFHKIIPQKIINSVPFCVNIHPSLLPGYRGPTPIEWMLKKNEKKFGITAHFITEKLDAGDILIQKKIIKTNSDNNKTLRKKLAELSKQVIYKLINQIRKNCLEPKKQDENKASYYPNYWQNHEFL